MADGSVNIAVNMNVKDADKQLAKLKSNIQKTQKQIEDITSKRNSAQGRSIFQGAELDAEKQKLAELKSQLLDLQTAAKDKSLSTGVRQELSSQIPALKQEVAEQQQRVNALQKEWNTVTASVERYDQRLADANTKLDQQVSEAGQFEAQMAGAASASRGMPSALESAATSMEKFTNRIKGLAKRVFVFTLITKALRSLRTWLFNSIMANDQAAQAIARLKGALITLAQPILNILIPAFTWLVNILTTVVSAIAKVISMLFGVDFSRAAKQAQKNLAGEAEAIGDVGSAAEEAEGSLAGFDEINTIQTENSGAAGGGGGGGGGAGGLTPDFSMWDNFSDKLTTVEKIILGIGSALAAWKIAKGVSSFLNQISGFTLGSGFAQIGMLGAAGIMLKHFVESIQDIVQNGANFDNVTAMIGNFTGAIGTIAALLGHTSFGGALVGLSGLADIVRSIKGFITDGINWENVITGIEGIGKVLMAIGLLTPYKSLIGAGMFLFGVPTLIEGVKSVVHAIQTGDWSQVDWVSLILGVTTTVGGVIQFFTEIKRIKGAAAGANATTTAIEEAAASAGGVNTAMGSATGGGLFGKLKTVAVNMGLGIAIIGEVAVAAGIIVGAIWGLGALLEQVGNAWEPVIANGETVAIAIGVGAGILATVGLVTYGLGSIGKTAAVNIGIGTLILAELGVATGLFIAEIWGIGWGLEKVGEAWKPVIANGETIEKAIEKGSELLLAVGVVTAALGAITIGTAGALPLAIGVGTAVLGELTLATIAFTDELSAVADEMTNRLAPSLAGFNEVLPGLTEDMRGFKTYMIQFAGLVVAYAGSTIIAGISGAVADIVTFFTGDPLANFTEEVDKTWKMLNGDGETDGLASLLKKTNPVLESVVTDAGSYTEYMGQLSGVITDYSGNETVSAIASAIDKIKGWFTTDPLTKFKKEVEKTYEKIAGKDEDEGLDAVLSKTVPILETVDGNANSYITNMNTLADDLSDYASTGSASGLETSVGTIEGWFANDPLVTLAGIVEANYNALAGTSGCLGVGGSKGLNSLLGTVIPELETCYYSLSSYVGYLNLISETTNGLTFTGISEAIFVDMTGIGSNLVAGFSQGIANAGGVGSPVISGLNDMLNNIGTYDWYSVGTSIGTGIVNGMYNIGQPLAAWGQAVLNEVQRMFAIHSPSRVFRDEVGYYLGTGLAVGLADSESNIMRTVSGLSDAMLSAFAGARTGFHFNGPFPPVPRLAQGAVIPPNREFMAVLGDQTRGNNIEAPESLIRQIVREESGGNAEILREILSAIREGKVMMVDRQVLARTAVKGINDMTVQAGKNVLLI